MRPSKSPYLAAAKTLQPNLVTAFSITEKSWPLIARELLMNTEWGIAREHEDKSLCVAVADICTRIATGERIPPATFVTLENIHSTRTTSHCAMYIARSLSHLHDGEWCDEAVLWALDRDQGKALPAAERDARRWKMYMHLSAAPSIPSVPIEL